MGEATEHGNPVTKLGTKTQSPPQPGLLKGQSNLDQSTSDSNWHSVQNIGRSKKPMELTNVHWVTNTAGTDCSF